MAHGANGGLRVFAASEKKDAAPVAPGDGSHGANFSAVQRRQHDHRPRRRRRARLRPARDLPVHSAGPRKNNRVVTRSLPATNDIHGAMTAARVDAQDLRRERVGGMRATVRLHSTHHHQ